MKVAVSACLLGENCKYNGGNNYNKKLVNVVEDHEVIAMCPEVLGGLAIPRPPAEIVNGLVRQKNGISVDNEFKKGAQKALNIIKKNKIGLVILQSRSPSCGVNNVYDGSFTGKLIEGKGVFARILEENNIEVIDVEDL
jgi:purine nucleoside phosphorylase